MSEVRYMISDAADKLGMEAHVLRYWEEELELDVPRNEMGHRYYTQEWISTFDQIRLLKKKGYQLRAIKMLIHSQKPCKSESFVMDLEQELVGFVNEDVGIVPVPNAHPEATSVKLEQFQAMMASILRSVLEENNQQFGQAVSEQVGEKVLKEMNYLMREREELEEARFRKLDEALRSRQRGKQKAEKGRWRKRKKFFEKNVKTKVKVEPEC